MSYASKISSGESGSFFELPDSFLTEFLAVLDIKSRLRLARVSTRFWRVCFETQRVTSWTRLEIPEYLDLDKYVSTLHAVRDLVRTLVIERYSIKQLYHIPVMKSVLHIELRGDLVLTFSVFHALGIRFWSLVSICAKRAAWEYENLVDIRHVFPLLTELKVETFMCKGQGNASWTEVNGILNILQGVETVRVGYLAVAGMDEKAVDRLAESNLGKGLGTLWVDPSYSAMVAEFERPERWQVCVLESRWFEFLEFD